MKNPLLQPTGLWAPGAALVRILYGIFLIYHSAQMFDSASMAEMGKWLQDIGYPMPLGFAYAGKVAELIGGVLIILGLYTRLASIVLAGTFFMITFTLGHGKIFTDDQHPFMFGLFALHYLFAGAGTWSLDERRQSAS